MKALWNTNNWREKNVCIDQLSKELNFSLEKASVKSVFQNPNA